MLRTMASGLRPLLLTGLALAALPLFGLATPARADKVGVAAAVNPDAFSQGTEVKIGNSIFYNQRINTSGKGLVQVLLVDGSTFTVGPGSDLVIDKFVYDPSKNKGEMVATLGKGVLRFVGGKLSKNEGGVTVNTPTGALAIRGGMFHLSVESHKILASFLFGNHMTITDGGINKDIFEVGYTYDSGVVRPTRPEDTAFFMKALSGGGQVVIGGADDNKDTSPPHNTAKVDVSEIKQDGTSDVVQGSVEGQLQQSNTPSGNPAPGPTPPSDNVRVLTNANFYTAFVGTPNEQDLSNPDVLPGAHGILGGDGQSTADDFTTTATQTPSPGSRLTGAFDIVSTFQDPGPDGGPFTQHLVGTFDFPAEFDQCDNFGICVVTDATLNGTSTGGPDDSEVFPITLKGSAAVRPGFVAYQLFGPSNGFDNFEDHGNSAFGQRIDFIQALRLGAGAFAGIDLNAPFLAVAGDKYTLPSQGQVHEFQLFTDPRQSLSLQVNGPFDGSFTLQNLVAPFATLEGSPFILSAGDFSLGNPDNLSISTLKVLEPDSAGGHGVWLQTSLYISTDGECCHAMQESQIVVALGNASNASGLTGERRGGSQINTFFVPGTPGDFSLSNHPETNDFNWKSQEQVSYTGGIATLAGANGAHFFGTDTPNIVIGADSTGSAHNIFLDTPLSDPSGAYASATYHIGLGSNEAPMTPTQTSGTFNGYAAGVVRTDGGDFTVGALVSEKPSDVTITFDAKHNTLQATLITHILSDENKGGLTLALGDTATTSGRSAFIDDQNYAAIETPGLTTVQSGNPDHPDHPNVVATGYLVSGQQLDADNVLLFPTVNSDNHVTGMAHSGFCNDCTFLKWGAWGTRTSFQDFNDQGQPGDTITADVHLGWWVAGDVVKDTVGALPMTGTASYAGNVIGNVANNLNGQGAITYVATGNMGMNWNFASRSGQFDISHFDTSVTPQGLSFGGTMTMPGVVNGQIVPTNLPNQFSGALSGNALGGLTGSAAGSFAGGHGTALAPSGVIGNWNIANSSNTYGAVGIFAGGRR